MRFSVSSKQNFTDNFIFIVQQSWSGPVKHVKCPDVINIIL